MITKKRIGIDARLINQTGVGTYIKNLLTKIDLENYQVFVFVRSIDESQISLPKNNIMITADFRWHSFSEQISFLRLLNSLKLDLVHFTYFSYPILYSKPFVITIHDLIPIKFPTGKASTLPFVFYWLKNMIAKIVFLYGIKKSQYVITPSQAVKDEISSYGVRKEKIVMTYEGVDQEILHQSNINYSKFTHLLPKTYWLYLGNFYPHKNIPRLLRAYALLEAPPILILKGPLDAFAHQTKTLVEKLGLGKKVVFFHTRLSGGEMRHLIKNASLLIQPSLAEGFGLPPIEASYLKTPVLVSKLPIFDEILGSRYSSFDPYSIDSIKKALYFAQKNKIKPIDIDINIFSFDKMAILTKNIYEKVLKD